MRPDDLNQTSDEELFHVIDHMVLCATASTTEAPPALAPFLTLELFRRTHERIVQLINSGRSHLAKHKALARAMCGLTSIRVPPDERDVEKIGNHIDIWLRRKYIDIERKLCRNIRNKQNLERKRAELRNSCCVISPMGRVEEFFGPFEDQRQQAPGQIELRPSPYVPYTHSSLPSAMSMLEMKEAVADAQRKASSAEADARKERLRLENERLRVAAVRSRCKRAAKEAASARKLAKSVQLEKTDIEVKAARELREFARRAQQESKQRERDGLTRKTNSELELEALIKNFALALSFYDRYKQRGIRSSDDIAPHLESLPSTQAKLDWLREQIEMRVVGLGWIEFKAQWSSAVDAYVGSISDLTTQLTEILEEEHERTIPEVAPAPIMQRKTFKQLGTATLQAEQLADQRLSMTSEQLLAAAVLERQRLEAVGILDTIGDRQPELPPPLNEELVGRKLEIC